MTDQHTSAVYHVAQLGQLAPGQLIHVEDRPGGVVDIYLHPLHARSELVWDFAWLMRHQVGNGLWRQRWTTDGRMAKPAQGYGIAESRWEIVPARSMPRGVTVVPIEEPGSCVWLIRSGYCTRAMRDAMNEMLERIVGDGLWIQCWGREDERRQVAVAPPLRSPALALPS